MIRLVSLEQVDNVWPVVRPWVEQACRKARSDRTSPQVYAMCRNGSLWMAVCITGPELTDIVGVSIMQISEVQGERVLQFVVVAGHGDSDAWMDELINWPWIAEMGVKRCVSEGRAGWPRRLKKLAPGLRVIRQVFEWPVQPAPSLTAPDAANHGLSDAELFGNVTLRNDAFQ